MRRDVRFYAQGLLLIVISFFANVFFPLQTRAVTPSYDAVLISVSAPRSLIPGQVSTVTVVAKNIGTAAWQQSGRAYFSLYHWDPVRKKEIASPLNAPEWYSSVQPRRLPQTEVRPGQIVEWTFQIRAPSVPGTYHADFVFCAEDVAWVKNSKFAIDVDVREKNTPDVSARSTANQAPVLAEANSEQKNGYAAKQMSGLGLEYQIDAGNHIVVSLAFQNTGAQTWKRGGDAYVSLYAVEKNKERPSLFKDFNWKSASQAAVLTESIVKPGEIGHFALELRAPDAPGNYQEAFMLAAENTVWIPGGSFVLPIKVPLYDAFVATAPPIDEVAGNVAVPRKGTYQASLLLRSVKQLVLSGNGSQELTFGFKNTGSVTWSHRAMQLTGVTGSPMVKTSAIRDATWMESLVPSRVQGYVAPGEIAFVTFKIKAPSRKGIYQASFRLQADNRPLEGGDVDIPITVTADGLIEPEPVVKPTPVVSPIVATPLPSQPSTVSPVTDALPINGDISTLPNEPVVRVGIFKTTDNRMQIRAISVALDVIQADVVLCQAQPGEIVTVAYDRGTARYSVSGSSCNGTAAAPYLVRTTDRISPMEIADFSRPVGWLPGANDNTFRAQLELRYTPLTDSVWVINELPMEAYLRGIAETSNSSPQEYQRALLTAARTYVYYHWQRATKHANEFFHVDAKYDQVYRGYGSEARSPTIVAAVDATRGQIVTYGGKLAITPYYSRSDGRTRAWTEVWGGGPYPWLVSVPVPWDQGRTLWGHGVGLSATGALGMANDGKKYDEILKYFYTGIELRRVYQ